MRIFGHPLHTMLVHFPLAFWTLASFCDGLALYGIMPAWQAATVLTGLGVIIAAIAMVPGLVDFATLEPGAQKSGLLHMSLMGLAWFFYLLAFIFHIENGAIAQTPDITGISFGMIGFLCMAVGGFYGGELVYTHGAGQRK